MMNPDTFMRETNGLFISYARADYKWVAFAEKEINRTDYDVWWDRKLKPGQDWWKTLCEQIKRCKFFLFVLTDASISSIYCKAELEYALALNKPILPIIPEHAEMAEIPEVFARIHCSRVDKREYFLHILEAGLCEIRLAIMLNEEEYAYNDLPIPTPPRLSRDQVYEAWEKANDFKERGDASTALKLFDQIIYSDPDGLGLDARKEKTQIEEDNQKYSLYERIKKLVDDNRLYVAKAMWIDFKKNYPDYDPNDLHINFSSLILEDQSIDSLKQNVDELFANDE